mgnify:CR=1 FL=1
MKFCLCGSVMGVASGDNQGTCFLCPSCGSREAVPSGAFISRRHEACTNFTPSVLKLLRLDPSQARAPASECNQCGQTHPCVVCDPVLMHSVMHPTDADVKRGPRFVCEGCGELRGAP